MMSKAIYANGQEKSHKRPDYIKTTAPQKVKANGTNLQVPIQRTGKQQTVQDGNANGGLSTHNDDSPVTAFSRSFGDSRAASSFNVYSMSPRTSVMYAYYKQPKGFFESQVPVVHSSKSNGHYCTNDHAAVRSHRERTISECCESPPASPPQVMRGIPPTLYNDMMEDPRRRAWSESDSHKKGNHSMHLSRLSALKKMKMKLARSHSGKKKKDEANHVDSLNQSNSSNGSIDERHLHATSSPNSSKRSTGIFDEDLDDFAKLSLNNSNDPKLRNTSASSNRRVSPSPSCRSSGVFSDVSSTQDVDSIYQRFLEEHTCYDIMPTSCKLVVFDTQLQACQAFHALIENAVRSAPLWDAQISCYVGMLTVTDFIKVILIAHRAVNMKVESIEQETINTWRRLLQQKSSFASVHPDDSLLHCLKILKNEHFHGLPVMDESTGDIFQVINHKRILRFLHLFINELPKPDFMDKTLADLKIGTFEDVATVTKRDTMLHVLELIVEKKLTAVPVVDGDGEVMDVFCKLDMISLAAQGLYHDLSNTLDVALACRFKPLFEDEECGAADAFARFSSPKPQRRDMNIRRKFCTGNDVSPSNDRRRQNEQNRTNQRASLRGHYMTRPHADNRSLLSPRYQSADETSVRSARLHPSPNPGAPHECAGHKVRHKSLSNPLVKCRLSDTFQHVMDLMVGTEAHLLVVIGQKSNHVMGVVTVTDLLYFMVNPPVHVLEQDSPSRIQRRSRHQFTSSSGSPLVRDRSDTSSLASSTHVASSPDGESQDRSRYSSSSVADSGYTSSSDLRKVVISNL